ncbi:MAG TPA: EF-hand domain-containing protein [Telluria sp.]|nr:EF-hand domain-containing protein [Telluria sp.]
MVASISSSTVSDWSNALYAKLDTNNQGYISKTDLEAAYAKATGTSGTSASSTSSSTTDTSAADQLFAQIDTNKDGKITKSELSDAVSKVADQLNAQYDQSRVANGGGQPPAGGGGHVNDGDGHGHGRVGAKGAVGGAGGAPASTGSTSTSTSSTSTSTYIAAADTNGDGTVSADEAAAYAKLQASGAATSGSQSADGLTKDQLSSELQAAGSSGSKHAAVLSKLVDNFDKADTNGDGKLTRDEAKSYLKSAHSQQAGGASGNGASSPAGTSSSDAASALANALQVLKAYVDSNQFSTPSVSVNA